jgi:hypothetical protein
MKVEATIHFGKKGKKKQALRAKPPVVGRTPRIAKLMALAIRFEGLIADGTVADYSELAELAQVSRARITQIMNLNLLAPELQEWLLFLPPVESGRDSITLGGLQAVCLEADCVQRSMGFNSREQGMDGAAPFVLTEKKKAATKRTGSSSTALAELSPPNKNARNRNRVHLSVVYAYGCRAPLRVLRGK